MSAFHFLVCGMCYSCIHQERKPVRLEKGSLLFLHILFKNVYMQFDRFSFLLFFFWLIKKIDFMFLYVLDCIYMCNTVCSVHDRNIDVKTIRKLCYTLRTHVFKCVWLPTVVTFRLLSDFMALLPCRLLRRR